MAQLQTLVKALDILTLLGQSDHPMSVEELAVALGLPKSTVYRLIQTLEAKDFARRYSRSEIDLGYHFIKIACRICLYRPATFLPCHHQAG